VRGCRAPAARPASLHVCMWGTGSYPYRLTFRLVVILMSLFVVAFTPPRCTSTPRQKVQAWVITNITILVRTAVLGLLVLNLAPIHVRNFDDLILMRNFDEVVTILDLLAQPFYMYYNCTRSCPAARSLNHPRGASLPFLAITT
jgi:hypothetical protein